MTCQCSSWSTLMFHSRNQMVQSSEAGFESVLQVAVCLCVRLWFFLYRGCFCSFFASTSSCTFIQALPKILTKWKCYTRTPWCVLLARASTLPIGVSSTREVGCLAVPSATSLTTVTCGLQGRSPSRWFANITSLNRIRQWLFSTFTRFIGLGSKLFGNFITDRGFDYFGSRLLVHFHRCLLTLLPAGCKFNLMSFT
jgi:hypothetical protein